MTEHEKRESCRNAVLEYLASRPSVAQRAETIHRRIALENPEFNLSDVADACLFLIEKGYVKKITDGLGSTNYYQSTAEGQLYVERRFGFK